MKIWIPRHIDVSDKLASFIADCFNKGGNDRMEVVDVLEWEPPKDIEEEAMELRKKYGDFVVRYKDNYDG